MTAITKLMVLNLCGLEATSTNAQDHKVCAAPVCMCDYDMSPCLNAEPAVLHHTKEG